MEKGSTMEKGKLSVQTENILPLIKKWLYSEKEIFLRELISNSFDAINKLKKITLSEEIRDAEDSEYSVEIKIDKDKGILSIEDNGLGMTAEEIKKFITQIAFSGAEEFIKKYEENADKSKAGIIGNFGLGFYSSFMISKRVEIDTLSYRPGETSAFWGSDGGEDFEISEGSRTKRGTTIRMFLEDEEKEFLDKNRISGLVRKYCDFLSVPIRVDGTQANKEKPLWTRNPSDILKEEYIAFYKHLFPYQGDPLFYVHMNVDYPFQLQGILYFPKLAFEMDVTKNNVRIYCKQVFVTEEAQDIVPQFLTILQGVIDLPELPLNVSRSYIQNEPQIKKIAQHIVKKVADRLNDEFRTGRKEFEKIWNDIAPFVKYGMLNDEKFYDQAKESLVFQVVTDKDEDSKFATLAEYQAANKEKTDSKVYYTTDLQKQAGPLRLIKNQGIDVILMNSLIDTHFLHFIENKNQDTKFVRVDADITDRILDKEEESKIVDGDDNTAKERIFEIFRKVLPDESIKIQVEALKSEEIPAIILLPEEARRFNDMTAIMRQENVGFLSEHILVVNIKNSIIKKMAKPAIVSGDETSGPTKEERIAKQIYFLARLAQGGVEPKEIDNYVAASFQFLDSFS
ncbi:MAG: molecular chaperone HtpG [Spirochaetia bacterium]|nr:molecular chaperone HtpG [Spirochaetia bacterium]